MKHLTATVLALALTATAGTASAQQYGSYPNDNYSNGTVSASGGYSDYARVVRVTPVYGYGNGGYAASTGGERCSQSTTYGGAYDRNGDGYADSSYGQPNGYGNVQYDRYGRPIAQQGYDRYGRPIAQQGYDRYGRPIGTSNVGSNVATVVGGIVGAVVGSQIGGGSARYATGAIGSMVGGMAGRSVYEQTQRNRYAQTRVGTVTTCDPVSVDAYNNGRTSASMYDVTYEYGGRTYTTRTSYNPGNRMRVRVDVRPE